MLKCIPMDKRHNPISAWAVVLISPKFPPSIPFLFGNFPRSINPLFQTHKTRSSVHFKGCGSTTIMLVYFSQYLHISKHPSPINQSLTAGVNSSLRAWGHVGCWVERHLASKSEGLAMHTMFPLVGISNNIGFILTDYQVVLCPHQANLVPIVYFYQCSLPARD